MLRVSAVAKLANVPRHPRGESYSPWVLICAGAVLPGIIEVDEVKVIGSQPFSDRMVVRNDFEGPGHGAADRSSWLRTCRIGFNRHGAAPRASEERLRRRR